MNKQKKPHKFRSALNNTFLFSVVLPISILLILFAVYIAFNVRDTNMNSYTNTLSVMNTAIDSKLDSLAEFSKAYENNSKFRTFFYFFYLYGDQQSDDYLLSYKERLVEYAQAVNSYLKLASLSDVTGIGFIPYNSESFKMLYHEVGSSYAPVVTYNGRDSTWYEKLINDPSSTLIEYEYASYLEHPTNVLTMVNTVWNNSGTAPIGFVKIDFAESIISDTVSTLTIAPNSRIEITLDDCDYSYGTEDNYPWKCHIEKLHNYEHNYTINYIIPLSDLYSGLPIKFLLVLACYAAALFMARLAFKRFSARVIADYKPITDTLSAYKGGNRPEKIEMDNFEIVEFREIADSLVHMIDDVEYHIDNEYKAAIERKRAQFRALQAEVNPHFLYNTLNNLLALNRIGDKKQLEQSIISLSKLFRYTCERNESGLSTVEDEFTFLEHYLKLQKLRYDERLEYSMSVDPDTLKYSIPKLLLQPLVENAIVHGLEPCDHPVTIQISSAHFYTRGIGEVYVLSVINNGCTFNVEDSFNHSRVGLTNIENRLHTFWPESVLIVKGGEDKLTEFHIVIKNTEGGLS